MVKKDGKMKMQAASAVAPVTPHIIALEHIASGLEDEVLGKIHMDKVQICPQHAGYVGDKLIDQLLDKYPTTEFRLHASPKLKGLNSGARYVSNARENEDYFKLADSINRRFGSSGYSIHAGERSQCSFEQMLDNLDWIQQISQTPISVEGLYPSSSNRWLMSSWQEYERVAEKGFHYALDLSHLNIVAKKHGRNDQLVRDLIVSNQCAEVHVSANDGRADSHKPLDDSNLPWWMDILTQERPSAVIFYEGILVDPRKGSKA